MQLKKFADMLKKYTLIFLLLKLCLKCLSMQKNLKIFYKRKEK